MAMASCFYLLIDSHTNLAVTAATAEESPKMGQDEPAVLEIKTPWFPEVDPFIAPSVVVKSQDVIAVQLVAKLKRRRKPSVKAVEVDQMPENLPPNESISEAIERWENERCAVAEFVEKRRKAGKPIRDPKAW